MKKISVWILAGIVLAGIFFEDSMYVVDENSLAVVRSLGNEVETKDVPGVYFKQPFIQDVALIEKRARRWDGNLKDIVTSDGQRIELEAAVYWQVSDPLKFMAGGQEASLTGLIAQALRQNLLDADLASLLLVKRSSQVLVELNAVGQAQGIEILDLHLKNINYSPEARPQVQARMFEERSRLTAELHSETLAEKNRIEEETSRQIAQIESEAALEVREILGKADREALKIVDDVYRKDPKLYTFFKTLKTYQASVNKKTTVLLSTQTTDHELLRINSGH